jgi:hypothetical protein
MIDILTRDLQAYLISKVIPDFTLSEQSVNNRRKFERRRGSVKSARVNDAIDRPIDRDVPGTR